MGHPVHWYMRGYRRLVAMCILLALAGAPAAGGEVEARVTGMVAALEAGRSRFAARPVPVLPMVRTFYAARGNRPAWGEPGAARQAAALLQKADAHGLDPNDYVIAAPVAGEDGRVAAAELARRDVETTLVVLQFLTDLRYGRVRPPPAPASWVEFSMDYHPAVALASALERQQVAQADEEAQPPLPLYARMRVALEAYRRIEQAYPRWPVLSIAAMRQFRSTGQLPAEVVERLRALGDLDTAGPQAAAPEYEAIDRALRRFQARHGLEADGVAGRATLEALSVSPGQRVRQLVLSLERLRWFPPLSGQRFVAVNVPAYRLWAVDLRPGRAAVALEMRVIVGAAGRTPTPVLAAPIRAVEFNPFWNVPRGIALEEIVPRMENAPDYLPENDMEALDSVSEIPLPPTADIIAALKAGRARIRQRPGPNNVLGPVKFLMPNPQSIYLHATDATSLFGRDRRDFSHGCIRVEKPAELAAFVLDDQQRWGLEQVAAAMASGTTETVPLTVPVMAVLFYTTAVTERDGRVMFYKDIYGLDRLLAKALAARPSTK